MEAPFDLLASVPAGTYHLVLDCIVVDPVDTTFDLIWRRTSTPDVTLFEFTEHYGPLGGGDFAPQSFAYDMAGSAIDYEPGDQLVFRYSANGSSALDAYVPNDEGSGSAGNGRNPSITLPVAVGGE